MPVQLVSDYLSEIPALGDGPFAPDVLIAESNHRIANNLSLIAGLLHLQATETAKTGEPLSAEAACLLLEEVGGRIQTVARLHRMLADVRLGATLDLRQYLHDIAEAAITSMSMAGEMSLVQTESDACEIRPHHAMSVGFIVGELVTNAVKYAHPTRVRGRIDLGCQSRPGGATLIQVADDGVGLPEGFDPAKEGGLGMRMVRTLANQLGANLSFDSTGIGLTIRLLLPPSGPVAAA